MTYRPPSRLCRSSSARRAPVGLADVLLVEHVPDPRHEVQLRRPGQRQVLEERGQVAAGGEVDGAACGQRAVQDAAAHHVAHRQEAQRDRRQHTLVVVPACIRGRLPHVRDLALGVHRALGGTGAAGRVDQQRQRIVTVGRHSLERHRPAAREHVGQCLDDHAAAVEGRLGRLEGVALVVDLGLEVEHHQPFWRGPRGDQLDGIVDVVDARRDQHRLGLGDDRPQLSLGRAGLQRHGHRAELRQGGVDDGVVDAGEPEDGDPVTGPDRCVVQGGAEGLDALPQLAVADGVEARQQLGPWCGRCRR